MRFHLTEEQAAIAAAVRGTLADVWPIERAQAFAEGDADVDAGSWQALMALGLGGLLVASVLFFQLREGVWSAHELLITLFLFITAPISANMIAKVHLHRRRAGLAGEPESIAGVPPAPGGDGDWATFEAPRPGSPAATSEA